MKKQSHHLWNAEKDEHGNVIVNRTVAEREEFDANEYARVVSASAWGLFGAGVVDELDHPKMEIPKSICARFEVTATQLKAAGDIPPLVKTWTELNDEYGFDTVAEIREFVVHGMKTRQASKYLNVPFIAAADLLDDMDIMGKSAVKAIVEEIRSGNEESAVNEYGAPAQKVASLFEEARQGLCKLAVDSVAADYWTAYYGEYGEQLVKEVKKRIRADVACDWLTKCGVDAVAAAYWQNYFSEAGYGKALTKDIPKKISPSNSKKKVE